MKFLDWPLSFLRFEGLSVWRFWRDDGARAAVRARIQVSITFLDEPVTAEELRSRGLTDLEVLRIPQGANPSWVSREQLTVLDELLTV